MKNVTPPPFCVEKKSRKRFTTVLKRVIVGIAVFIAYSFAFFFSAKTLYKLWIPWVISAIIALTLSTILWKFRNPLISTTKFILKYLTYSVCITGVIAGLIFSLNYLCSDTSSQTTVSAKVIEKYTKTRYHTKRVGRRYTGQGKPYKVYYIVAELPDGRTKEFGLTLSQYNRTRRNSEIQLTLETGLLSIPVIKDSSISTPPKKRR